jgi:hypothetical protein
MVAEVIFIGLVDFAAIFSGMPAARAILIARSRRFFRRNPPQEGKVAALPKRGQMQLSWNAVVHRRDKMGVRQWFALIVGDGS